MDKFAECLAKANQEAEFLMLSGIMESCGAAHVHHNCQNGAAVRADEKGFCRGPVGRIKELQRCNTGLYCTWSESLYSYVKEVTVSGGGTSRSAGLNSISPPALREARPRTQPLDSYF